MMTWVVVFQGLCSDCWTHTYAHTHSITHTNLHTPSCHTSANKVDDFNHHNMLRTQTHPQGANQLLQSAHTHTYIYTHKDTHNQAKLISLWSSFFFLTSFCSVCVFLFKFECVYHTMLPASAQRQTLWEPHNTHIHIQDTCKALQTTLSLSLLEFWDRQKSKPSVFSFSIKQNEWCNGTKHKAIIWHFHMKTVAFCHD